MQVAITGATGFIGKKLVLRHLAQGDQVRVLSRRDPVAAGLPAAVKWFPGNLEGTTDLRDFVSGVDVLYHCAGEIRDEAQMKKVHVDGTQRLLEAASGRIGRWVQLSSTGIYGRVRNGVVTEQTELKPCGIYEITKRESDELVQKAGMDGAFEFAILRPSIVYGGEMRNQSLFGLIRAIQNGWYFFIGKPGASANYIHVDNVVEALVLCGSKPGAQGQVYNLSDHRSVEQFVGAMAAALGKAPPHFRLPEWAIRLPARYLGMLPKFPLTEARIDALTGRTIYSTQKIETGLGYRHVVSMEEGLEELVRSWRNGANASNGLAA